MDKRRLFLAFICLAAALGLQSGAVDAAPPSRPKITWTVSGSTTTPLQAYAALPPGHSLTIDITLQTSQDIQSPRFLLQSPNGTRVMRMASSTLPPVLPASA